MAKTKTGKVIKGIVLSVLAAGLIGGSVYVGTHWDETKQTIHEWTAPAVDEKDKTIAELATLLQSTQDDLKSAQNEIDEKKISIATLTSNLSEIEERLDAAKADNAASQETIYQLEEQKASISTELQVAQNSLVEKEQQLTKLTIKINELEVALGNKFVNIDVSNLDIPSANLCVFNNVILLAPSKDDGGLWQYDIAENSLSQIYETGKWEKPIKVGNGCLVSSLSQSGILYYDSITKTVSLKYSFGQNWTNSNYVAVVKNGCFLSSAATKTEENDGFLYFDIETKQITKVYETRGWNMFSEVDDGCFISQSGDNVGLLYFDNNTKQCSQIYSIGEKWQFAQKVQNGYLIGCTYNGQGLLYVDVETNTVQQVYDAGAYWCEFSETANGCFVSSKNSGQGLLYFNSETQTCVKILDGSVHIYASATLNKNEFMIALGNLGVQIYNCVDNTLTKLDLNNSVTYNVIHPTKHGFIVTSTTKENLYLINKETKEVSHILGSSSNYGLDISYSVNSLCFLSTSAQNNYGTLYCFNDETLELKRLARGYGFVFEQSAGGVIATSEKEQYFINLETLKVSLIGLIVERV